MSNAEPTFLLRPAFPVSPCAFLLLFDLALRIRENREVPESGPVAQLGARFHGMEEVIGSIPIRSTKHLNNLDNANALGQSVCVIVCVITPHFAAF